MNRWNDIAIVLQDCQSGKILEKDYQPKIEEQFKLLGVCIMAVSNLSQSWKLRIQAFTLTLF